MTLTNDRIRQAIAAAGLKVPAAGQLFLFGLRGARRLGPQAAAPWGNVPDRYDDVIGCGGTHLEVFTGSVDPGLHYTRRPLNPEGCAHLEDGGPYLYQLGLHRGHRALTQAGPVRYWRDADRDAARDGTATEKRIRSGYIGLNIHAGGASAVVGPHSAGCQVIQGGWAGAPWLDFLSVIERAAGQKVFPYYLLDARDVLS